MSFTLNLTFILNFILNVMLPIQARIFNLKKHAKSFSTIFQKYEIKLKKFLQQQLQQRFICIKSRHGREKKWDKVIAIHFPMSWQCKSLKVLHFDKDFSTQNCNGCTKFETVWIIVSVLCGINASNSNKH